MEVNSRSILRMLADHFKLSRSTIEERLRLQKIVYLLQAYGMKLGYGYVWYKHGPYSQDLVFDSYAVLTSESEKYKAGTKEWKFSQTTREKLDVFKDQLGEILGNVEKLELLASVKYVLKEEYGDSYGIDETEFANKFLGKKTRLFLESEIDQDQIAEALGKCRGIFAN